MANKINGPMVVLDFKRNRVDLFSPGAREGTRELKKALDVQKRMRPTVSGIVPPVKGTS